MKNLLVVVLMFLAVNCFAQFELKTGVGMGVEIDSKLNYELFQSSIAVTPQYTIDSLVTVGAVAQTFISDSITTPYLGINVSYPVWVSQNKSRKLYLSAQYLHGDEGRQLIGGSVSYGNASIELELSAAQEYKSKTAYIGVGLNYFLIR